MEQEKSDKQITKHKYNQTYYYKHKESLLNKLSQKFDCECGGKYTHAHRIRHLNCKKHKQYELNKNQVIEIY